jgi:hypothetical protein
MSVQRLILPRGRLGKASYLKASIAPDSLQAILNINQSVLIADYSQSIDYQ